MPLEPKPVPWQARIDFMLMSTAQEAKGLAKYGRELTVDTDVDLLNYAQQEAVDLWHYLVGERLKRDRLHAALKRWVVARDATTGVIVSGTPVEQVVAAMDDATAADRALVALAREVAS